MISRRAPATRAPIEQPLAKHSAVGWWALGIAAILLVNTIVNRDLLSVLGSALPGNLGDPLLNAWILGWVSQALLQGGGGLWDAPIFYPHQSTLAFSEPLLGLAPISAPISWMTGDAVATYNLTILALSVLAFAGATALVRELTGRLEPAIAVGLLVAASPYLMVSQMARIQMLSCGWSFLALAALHRFLGTRGLAALGGFVAAYVLQALSNIYLGIYLAVPVGMVLLHALVTGDLRRRPRALALLAMAVLTVGGLLYPVARTLAQAQERFDVRRSADESQRYSADVSSYLSVWHEQAPDYLRPEITSDRALFPGGAIVVLAMAGTMLGLYSRRRAFSHPAAAYIGVGIAAFVLSLGPTPAAWGTPLGVPGPYQWLVDWVPGFDALRAPGRFAVYVLMALAVPAGFALAAVFARVPVAGRVAGIVVCAVIATAEGSRRFDWVAHLPPQGDGARAAYAWLAEQPRRAMIELPIVGEYQEVPRIAGASQTLFYQLATLRHGHPLVNGSSGFTPPLTAFLEGTASPLAYTAELEAALLLLRELGVRHMVIHMDKYAPHAREHATTVVALIGSSTSHVESQRSFNGTHIFALRPTASVAPFDPSGLQRVPPHRTSVSLMGEPLPQLTDGDMPAPAGRWRSERARSSKSGWQAQSRWRQSCCGSPRILFPTTRGDCASSA